MHKEEHIKPQSLRKSESKAVTGNKPESAKIPLS